MGGVSDNPDRGTTTERGAKGHSGRFLVRMPSELHERLAQAADREHVSLNRFVNDALAASVAPVESATRGAQPVGDAQTPAPSDPPRHAAHNPTRALRIALATNVLLVAVAGVAAVVLLALALQHGA